MSHNNAQLHPNNAKTCFEITGKTLSPKKTGALQGHKSPISIPAESLNSQMATLNQGLMSLYHASAELQFSKPLPSLLKSILRGLKSGTGISKAVIFIKDESSFSLNSSVGMGVNEKKIE